MRTSKIVSAVFGMIIKVAVAIVIIMFIYEGALEGYAFGYRIFAQTPMTLGTGKTVTVVITEEMTPKEMGEMFLEKGLIRDTTLFIAQYYLSEFREQVKPGTYDLNTSMTVEDMMEFMASSAKEEGNES